MYFITYKNTIKADKEFNDFLTWLAAAWMTQKKWGADDVKYWQIENEKLIICQYHVTDLSLWIKMALSSKGIEISNALNSIIETDKMSLKITRTNVIAA